ncbi:MAG TPA: hypothetical protein VNG90_04750, partial [Candidatus Acidoferrum sp.]|nr:hypothetical protein [Candidatus Acidoferrum sp.]
LGIDESRVQVIQPGIEVSQFAHRRHRRVEVLHALGIPLDAATILLTMPASTTALPLLLTVVNLYLRRDPEAHMFICEAETERSSFAFEALLQTHTRWLADRARVHAFGPTSLFTKLDLFCAVDGCLLTVAGSYVTPLTFLQAVASGLSPVIAAGPAPLLLPERAVVANGEPFPIVKALEAAINRQRPLTPDEEGVITIAEAVKGYLALTSKV